jgi:hypothetical protein
VGFLKASLPAVSQALVDLRGEQHGTRKVQVTATHDPFPDVLKRLEPLSGGTPARELMLSTDSDWTAYLNCYIQGTDATGIVSYLAEVIRCQGVTVRSVPHTWTKRKNGRIGSVQLQIFSPDRTDFLNYVRTVEATHDGNRWIFHATGKVQDFERLERYAARTIPDRFPPELLDEYCRAMGIRYFEPTFYESAGVVVESEVHVGPGVLVMRLAQAQAWLGIEPSA